MKEIYSTGDLALEETVIQTSTISASKASKLFYISFELKSGSVFFVRDCNFGGSVAKWFGRSELQHDLL